MRHHETLRKLALLDEGFIEGHAGLGINTSAAPTLDPRTIALLQVAASIAIGSSSACLEWSVARALATGVSDGEVTDVLLAIAPVAGLGRVTSAAPDVAAALGYDVAAALEDPDSPRA